jgi:anthranilate phosphoribosyltransferase
MSLKEILLTLLAQQDLDAVTCQQAVQEILSEEANDIQIGAFLALLRAKGETSLELATILTQLKQRMVQVVTSHKVLDIVGTGGDGANTINISTASAILAASCGVKIVKHGSQAVSSLAGSADVLQALGINIQQTPAQISASVNDIGIGFCFAPNFHPALQKLRHIRKQLGVPTTLNIIGPLLNPAHPAYTILGVYNAKLMQPIAQALQQAGIARALVVHGQGLDELSCMGPAKVVEVTADSIKEITIDPQALGLPQCQLTDLKGGTAAHNAQIIVDVFSNKNTAAAGTLILNAAAALYLYGIHSSLAEAIAHAGENLYSGNALTLLNNWIEHSNA